MIGSPKAGPLTQGTIFSCAIAEDYEGCVVHGLVITARCDVTNDKAEVYNYIPIVKFDDWMHREGARTLADRTLRSSMGEMRNSLLQLGFAPAILNTTLPHDVLRVIFDTGIENTKVGNKREHFAKHVKRYNTAGMCTDFVPNIDAVHNLLALERSEAGKLVKELCANAIAEAYYLPRVAPQEAELGYVALLREIRHVPRALARAIATGLDQPSYAALSYADSRCARRLAIEVDGFAWPTGMVQSPHIEHLMQRLTLLFSRIGVSDVSESSLKLLQARIANASGAQ